MSYDTMVWILTKALWVAAITTTLFPIVYTVVARWYVTPEGRAVFFFATSTAILIDLTLLFQHWTPPSLEAAFWIEVGAWGFAALTAGYQVFAMLRAQRTLSPRRRR